jgi:hypothetical protein
MSLNIDQIITSARDNMPSSLIVKRISKHFFYKKSPKLYVITPYWQATMSQFSIILLKRRILNSGNSCLIYQFPIKILSDNVHLTEQYFKEIETEIKKDVENIKLKHGFIEVVVVGMSLGCVNALMVSNKNNYVNKVILVVPGDSLSDSLWRGIGTRKLKNQIKRHNINLKELEKDWQDLDPKNNIDGLANKYIEIYISKSDKIIPYTNGHHLVVDIENIGLRPVVIKNKRLGHYLTLLKFVLFKNF